MPEDARNIKIEKTTSINEKPLEKTSSSFQEKGVSIHKDFLLSDQKELFSAQSQNPADSLQSAIIPVPQPKKSGGKKIFFIVGAVASFFLLAGGSAFAYFFYLQPPEKIIEQSLAKFMAEKSYSYTGSLDYSDAKPSTILSFEGSFDKTNPEETKSKLSASLNMSEGEALLGSFSAQIDLISLGKIIYFKLGGIKSGTYLPAGLDSYSDKWIKIDPDSIKEMVKENMPESGSFIEDQLEQKSSQPTAEQTKEIEEAYVKSGIFKVTKKLPSEKIGGTSTFHYQFELDKEKIKQLIADIEKIKDPNVSEDKLNTLKETLDSAFDSSLNSLEQEIWIGKWDWLPRKIQFKTEKSGKQTSFSFTVTEYGVSFEVKEPEDSTPLEEIIFGSLNQAKADATIASFRSTVISANPAAMACADESAITGGKAGSPICTSKTSFLLDDTWPKASSGICSNELAYISNDTVPNDGKYSYAASCHSQADEEKVLVVCSQEGCSSSGKSSQKADSDMDNFPNELESIFGTDSNNPDSDGDGYKDGDEIINGYSPLINGK
jgi:hypothetical protein